MDYLMLKRLPIVIYICGSTVTSLKASWQLCPSKTTVCSLESEKIQITWVSEHHFLSLLVWKTLSENSTFPPTIFSTHPPVEPTKVSYRIDRSVPFRQLSRSGACSLAGKNSRKISLRYNRFGRMWRCCGYGDACEGIELKCNLIVGL